MRSITLRGRRSTTPSARLEEGDEQQARDEHGEAWG